MHGAAILNFTLNHCQQLPVAACKNIRAVFLRLRDTGPGEVTNLFEHGVDAQANIMFNRP
jgi:hypothetical protein